MCDCVMIDNSQCDQWSVTVTVWSMMIDNSQCDQWSITVTVCWPSLRHLITALTVMSAADPSHNEVSYLGRSQSELGQSCVTTEWLTSLWRHCLSLCVCVCLCLSVCLSVREVFKDMTLDIIKSNTIQIVTVEHHQNVMTVCNEYLLKEQWN